MSFYANATNHAYRMPFDPPWENEEGGFQLLSDSEVSTVKSLSLATKSVSSAPAEEWNKIFGRTGYDWSFSVAQTTDGGYIVTGSTNSSAVGGDVIWLIKVSGEKIEHPVTKDWPMFRHDPTHTGCSPETISMLSEKPIWKFETDGAVGASPAVSDGKVFACGDRYIHALDEVTGDPIWKNYTGMSYYIQSSPAVGYQKVFVGNMYGRLYAFSADSGDRLWMKSLDAGTTPYGPKCDLFSSPVVASNKVFVGTAYCSHMTKDYLDRDSGHLWALWANNGEETWEEPFEAAGPIFSSPAVANGKVFFGCNHYPSQTGKIYCLDANTGKEIWSYDTEGGVVSSPAVVNGKVFVGCNDHKIYALHEEDINGDKIGDVIWSYETKRGGYVSSSPAVANGRVFIGCCDGWIYCLHEEDKGEEQLIWEQKIGSGANLSCNMFSSPAVADGLVFVGSDDNNIYALDDESGGNIVWSYTTDGPVSTSPAVADGKVFVTSKDHYIYAFGEGAGLKKIEVDDDFVDDPPNHKWDTIQEGINDAEEGDTVLVYNGTYRENVVVDKSIVLKGIDYPTVNARESKSVITITADSCSMFGFKVINSGSSHGDAGIKIESNNTQITDNIICDNYFGIYSYSFNNHFYHNNFRDNTQNAYDDSGDLGTNYWDNGYPGGGNYWSDYNEESEGAIDVKSGQNQDQPGSDGIVDSPYEIPGGVGAKDNYPLMEPWGKPDKTEYWAVLVGGTTDHAKNDVIALKNVLMSNFNFDPNHNLEYLIEEDSTKENIEAKIEWMKQSADENDVCLFFFSGHGAKTGWHDPHGDPVCIGAYDDIIKDTELEEWFKDFKTNNLLFIFGSCHSGGLNQISKKTVVLY